MCKTWQDTKIHPRPRTEDAKFETSRGVIIDPAVEAGFGDARRRGSGITGGCRIRGDPKRRRNGGTEGARNRGNLGTCCAGPLKDERFEETRRAIAGAVGRRGDGETRSLNGRPKG